MNNLKDIVAVTDHLQEYSVERDILGNYFSETLNKDVTIVLVWHQSIDYDFLKKYPNVRAVVRYGVGFDKIDLDICKKKNIIVANTPDYGIDEVSDTALALILNLVRKINSFQSFARVDQMSWKGKKIDFTVRRLRDMSLGIVGLGRIGGSLARKFLSLSPNVSFYDPNLPSGVEKVLGIKRFPSLNDLLRNSDIVSIHTPLNKETNQMIDDGFISNMKKGSFLINVSRGAIVKHQDIIFKALNNRQIEGYGTDVWTIEPPFMDDKLYKLFKSNDDFSGRLIVTPHTAYYSLEALKESRDKACKNCLNIIKGNKIENRII